MQFQKREIREKTSAEIGKSFLIDMAESREQMKRFRFAHEINLI